MFKKFFDTFRRYIFFWRYKKIKISLPPEDIKLLKNAAGSKGKTLNQFVEEDILKPVIEGKL